MDKDKLKKENGILSDQVVQNLDGAAQNFGNKPKPGAGHASRQSQQLDNFIAENRAEKKFSMFEDRNSAAMNPMARSNSVVNRF